MAELTPKTITELPTADTVASTDYFAVSSGGESKKVPGNAVVNTSGSGYCKMPDGTLLCWGSISVSQTDVDTAWGSFYESSEINISGQTFPVSFVSAPSLILRLRASPVAFLEDKITASTTGLTGSFRMTRPTIGYNCAGSIYWLATGRWK